MPNDTHRHSRTDSWYHTSGGEIRGSIRPHSLDEVWFHTGTTCNLSCSFCLEGSKPGDERLQRMRFEDVRPFIDEALFLGVKQFSFTGGEPFVVRDLVRILDYALTYRPCLVLTNATDPLIRRLPQIQLLKKKPVRCIFGSAWITSILKSMTPVAVKACSKRHWTVCAAWSIWDSRYRWPVGNQGQLLWSFLPDFLICSGKRGFPRSWCGSSFPNSILRGH